MNDVVICDTNAAIHLAILCPEILKASPAACRIVIHPIVKQEIQDLIKDDVKNSRLGDILAFIDKEVIADTKIGLPPQDKEKQLHGRIKSIEAGLDRRKLSSGSSHLDRRFLIIAWTNKVKLLTNEKTLYYLGEATLGTDRVWRTSNAIETLLASGVCDKKVISANLVKLRNHYKEVLHEDCDAKFEELGL